MRPTEPRPPAIAPAPAPAPAPARTPRVRPFTATLVAALAVATAFAYLCDVGPLRHLGWLIPAALAIGAALLGGALAVAAFFARGETRRHLAHAAVALIAQLAALPIAAAIAQSMVHDAQRYCEARARGQASPEARPRLLAPGYSTRYPFIFDETIGTDGVRSYVCRFPDVGAGRTSWTGESVGGGVWHWEHLMD